LALLDDDEKNTVHTVDGTAGNPDIAVINEPGVYALAFKSRKSEAKLFKRWLTHDVLPSIRKHGAYLTDAALEKVIQDPSFMIAMITRLNNERDQRLQAEAKVQALAPKAELYEILADENGWYTTQEVAKKLAIKDMGPNNLYQFLLSHHLVFRADEEHASGYRPVQSHINSGHMRLGSKTYVQNGITFYSFRTLFSLKGIDYLYKVLTKAGYRSMYSPASSAA